MTKNIILVCLLIAAATQACKQWNTAANTALSNADTSRFFSVSSFIKSEMQLLDSMPYYIYLQTTNANGHKDSVTLSKPGFDSLAQAFIQLDIVALGLKDKYTEQSFQDLSTNSITLNYLATDKSLPIQMIQVLLNEDNSKVNRLYIKTFESSAAGNLTKTYSWKAGKSFYIATAVQKEKQAEQITKQFVNWNDTNHL